MICCTHKVGPLINCTNLRIYLHTTFTQLAQLHYRNVNRKNKKMPPKKEKPIEAKAVKEKEKKKAKEVKTKNVEKLEESLPAVDEEEPALSPLCTYAEITIDCPEQDEELLAMTFVVMFKGQIYVEGPIQHGAVHVARLSLNLKQPQPRSEVADNPLVFLIKDKTTKPLKAHDTAVKDPFLNSEFRAGATLDLFPLALGEEEVFVHVPLVQIPTGDHFGVAVDVFAKMPAPNEKPKSEKREDRTLLTITMLEAHFLPHIKESKEILVYICAMGLDKLSEPSTLHFGSALSHKDAKRSVWSSVSAIGNAGSTLMSLPDEDVYLPEDVVMESMAISEDSEVKSAYWHAMKRILVDRTELTKRLRIPLFLEIALVPKTGKLEAKARYMAFVDASVLLEPGTYGATVCAKLKYFNEFELSESFSPVLEFPPQSAKTSAKSARENKTGRIVLEPGIIQVTDEQDRDAIVTLRFDLTEPLVPRLKTALLFEIIGYPDASADKSVPFDELYLEPPPDDPTIDVHKIRKECGALAVHKELGALACRGSVPMNQSIKRTAANRLLMRVRSMVKQFMPAPYPMLEWMDTVTSQHAASRRAVTASFMPPPATLRLLPRFAASRSLVGGQEIIANSIIETNLKVLPNHPRSLLLKALTLLEEGENTQALTFILKALDSQPRNRFLLWTYGAQEFFKDYNAYERAIAAFRIGVRGDPSDGIANAIGWAVLHAAHHYNRDRNAAFVATKRMKKYFSLPRKWEEFLNRWGDTSGREELYWNPNYISKANPFLLGAAFFLCLRCYMMTNVLLCCFESGCYFRGSGRRAKTNAAVPDLAYLRAASLLLRRQYSRALKVTDDAISTLGPYPILSQMRNSCLTCERGWDEDCQRALEESERFGIKNSPAVLYQAALHDYKTNPEQALQRASRAHKTYPGPFSALMIGRIYLELGREDLAERWAAMSVKMEPSLTDGWAFLGMLALLSRNIDKAHVLLHTSRQTGIVSADIADEIHRLVMVLHAERLPDSLMKKLCVCKMCCTCSEDNIVIS